eukprot:gene23440-30725_t
MTEGGGTDPGRDDSLPGPAFSPSQVLTDGRKRFGPTNPAVESVDTVRQHDGLWYPPTAYLLPPAPPPPPRTESTTQYFSTHSHSQQWMYPAYPPVAQGYSGYAQASLMAVGGGYYAQDGCWHAGPIMLLPYDMHQAHLQQHMQLWQAQACSPSMCTYQSSQWVEDEPDCPLDEGSDSDSGSCSGANDSTLPTSPNYVVDPSVEGDGWGSMAVSVFQNVLSKLGESEAKSVRLVCQHWRAVFDHNLEQLTPSILMSKVIVMRFPNLRALHLTNCCNIRNGDLKIIAHSGLRLHTLTLGDDTAKPWVTNKGIACISQITSLTSLNLQDCNNVTNNGMAPLNKLSSLEALSLKGCKKLTNGGLEALQRNTALTSLNLFGCLRIADKGLLFLSNLNLVTLTLGCTRVKDEGLAYLAKMTSLQELHFEKEEMTDMGLKTLTSLTNLHSLALRDCGDVSGDSLSNLIPQLPKLQSLDLYKNFSIDDSQLSKCLEFLGSVTFLDLRGTFVTEDGLQELTRLSSLQKLCLAPAQNGETWGEYMCVISNLTQLTSLTINSCQLISFPLAKSLRQLKQLRELDLSDEANLEVMPQPPVNNTAVDVMATITSLTSIDLSRRPVHEDHLSVLAERLPLLHQLIIIGCPVLSSEVQALQRRFPELTIHRKPLPDVSCSSSDHGSSTGYGSPPASFSESPGQGFAGDEALVVVVVMRSLASPPRDYPRYGSSPASFSESPGQGFAGDEALVVVVVMRSLAFPPRDYPRYGSSPASFYESPGQGFAGDEVLVVVVVMRSLASPPRDYPRYGSSPASFSDSPGQGFAGDEALVVVVVMRSLASPPRDYPRYGSSPASFSESPGQGFAGDEALVVVVVMRSLASPPCDYPRYGSSPASFSESPGQGFAGDEALVVVVVMRSLASPPRDYPRYGSSPASFSESPGQGFAGDEALVVVVVMRSLASPPRDYPRYDSSPVSFFKVIS